MATTTAASKARSKALKLQFPFEHQGVAITEVIVRRPKGKDMRFLPKGTNVGVEDMYPFYAQLTSLGQNGAPIEESMIDDMDAADVAELGAIIDSFLPKKTGGRPTGA